MRYHGDSFESVWHGDVSEYPIESNELYRNLVHSVELSNVGAHDGEYPTPSLEHGEAHRLLVTPVP